MKGVGPEWNKVNLKVTLNLKSHFLKTDFRTEMSRTDILGGNIRCFHPMIYIKLRVGFSRGSHISSRNKEN